MQYRFYYTEANLYVVKKIVRYNTVCYLYIYLLSTNFGIICIFGQKHKSHILIGFRFYFRHERNRNVILDRRFYIYAFYGGCDFDAGWLLVHDIQSIQYCGYEKENHPKGKVNVLISPLKQKSIFHNGKLYLTM
jgi:hypothetical protein